MGALLFDLDETLMVEEPAAAAAFDATAEVAAAHHGIDPKMLSSAARSRARGLWYAAPTHDYCMRVGISSWEGLWCRFEGSAPDVRALREWSPTYRHETWKLALADEGVDDADLAEELAGRFGDERRARHEVFADVAGVFSRLKESHSMALVTNGAACLQREKLAASGLGDYFEAVVVSADLGVAKPDPFVFEHALSRLGACNEHARDGGRQPLQGRGRRPRRRARGGLGQSKWEPCSRRAGGPGGDIDAERTARRAGQVRVAGALPAATRRTE